jgi:2-polyprenyl-6-methoxyphenol hydroxylase-like FAD-dependent oxidoreductase
MFRCGFEIRQCERRLAQRCLYLSSARRCAAAHSRCETWLLQLPSTLAVRSGEPPHNIFSSQRRLFASSSSYSFIKGEKLRVAVVGGGCAGLSSALHLAPLVEKGLIAGPIDVFDEGSAAARDIGVGIWSTALDPFRKSNRTSHELVYRSMASGTWLNQVGYRTPDGAWLMKSKLPANEAELDAGDMPALLFLRERDMLEALQKAAHWEEQRGTMQVHRNAGRVQGLYEESSEPWSTNVLLGNKQTTNAESDGQKPTLSERDYHLIIAADGMNSVLRRTYGGHESETRRLIGTAALPSPIDLPNSMSNIDYNSARGWDKSQHQEVVGLQDRRYTVYRGNSQATRKDLGQGEISFQTWGTGHSMRFATVPMLCPTISGREERQVWFITIDSDEIANEADPVKRRDLLLKEFKDWHDPIRQTVLATPPEEILVERAIAHRHCMGPVLSFNTNVIRHLRGRRPPSSGEGPCIVFVGDAYMTVDPILAQGFTLAMEGAAALRKSVKQSCKVDNEARNDPDPQLAFDPIQLRIELKQRQSHSMDRLICLLRATELVQALGQPSGNTTMSGILNTKVLRPITRLLPNFIKAPIFDAVLKYSLGLGLFFRKPK